MLATSDSGKHLKHVLQACRILDVDDGGDLSRSECQGCRSGDSIRAAMLLERLRESAACTVEHPRLISALALSRPTLHMEDFRRKAAFESFSGMLPCRCWQVQQRYRSIEAIFRESFEHLENEDASHAPHIRKRKDCHLLRFRMISGTGAQQR